MRIKVCGMKYPENIAAIQKLKPDFMGFIFYEKSPRYIDDTIFSAINNTKGNLQTIGVFVNNSLHEVREAISKYELDFVQLHGDESVEYVRELSLAKVKVIKTFQIQDNFDWSIINNYAHYIQYFLFDTKTKKYGGSGIKFNWAQLNNYKLKIPFFLSGGITINDVYQIKNLKIPQLFAIDINSKFETEPGIKDLELVQKMINEIRNETNISSK
jgi:phosphoribosylanthranilate isomerase